ERVDMKSVSVLNMAGETIPQNYLNHLDYQNVEIRNLYGPSEYTTYATNYIIKENRPILIGKPIANTCIYVLSSSKQLLPIGVPGQLYISGAGLTRGYLNRPDLTSDKFI